MARFVSVWSKGGTRTYLEELPCTAQDGGLASHLGFDALFFYLNYLSRSHYEGTILTTTSPELKGICHPSLTSVTPVPETE